MRTVAIIQARMGSERLPGKVLMDLCGKPMLRRVVDRVRSARLIDEVVIATSTELKDDQVAEYCRQAEISCFRGHHSDVLDRYHQAAEAFKADHVVRVTADCPLIDAGVIDEVVRTYHEMRPAVDYVSNVIAPRHFPRGLDVEVFSADALHTAWRESTAPLFREHVTTFLYHHPERFRLQGVFHTSNQSHHRWTVDTTDDLRLVREIQTALGTDHFSWLEALAVVEAHPEWQEINAHIQQKAA